MQVKLQPAAARFHFGRGCVGCEATQGLAPRGTQEQAHLWFCCNKDDQTCPVERHVLWLLPPELGNGVVSLQRVFELIA
jgi:hypothetical protein